MNTQIKKQMSRVMNTLVERGKIAHELATRHGIVDRLPEGMLDALVVDIEALETSLPKVAEARRKARAATVHQRQSLEQGMSLARGLRTVVRKASKSAAVRKRYAVGAICNGTVITQVVSVLEQIVNRAEAEPAEAKELGIVAEDLVNLHAMLDAIRAADKEQRVLCTESIKATEDRTLAARRTQDAIGRIAAAGLARFATSEVAEAFKALTTALSRPRKPEEPDPKSTPAASEPTRPTLVPAPQPGIPIAG